MANGDTTTQDKPQLDEFGEPIPTQEEMNKQAADREAERLKTDQTIKLVGAMNQTVAPLPMTLPTQSSPVGAPPPPMTGTQPMSGALPPGALTAGTPPLPQSAPGGMPPAAPVQPPTQAPGAPGYEFGRGIGVLQPPTAPAAAAPPPPQGRMYMGPAMTAPQESAFMQSPAGTRQNLMPGWTPEKWNAATQEGVTRAPTPEMLANMKRYDAQKSIQQAVSDGMPTSQAIQMYGQGLFPTMSQPMSAGAQASLDERVRHNKVTEAGRPPSELVTKVQNGKTYQQRNGQWVHVPDVRSPMDTITETLPAVAGHGETKRTRHVPVESPSTKAPAVGDVLDGYRFKGGNPSNKSNWEKV